MTHILSPELTKNQIIDRLIALITGAKNYRMYTDENENDLIYLIELVIDTLNKEKTEEINNDN